MQSASKIIFLHYRVKCHPFANAYRCPWGVRYRLTLGIFRENMLLIRHKYTARRACLRFGGMFIDDFVECGAGEKNCEKWRVFD